MTRLDTISQADRLYKAMVKDGWSSSLELIDYCDDYMSIVPELTYLVHIHNENGDIVSSHEITMSAIAADTWMVGGLG